MQDLEQKVAEQCKQMEKVVRPLFTVAEIDNKKVVSVEIPGVDISERPVYYKGIGRIKGSYIRVGEADEQMTDYEIYSYEAYRRRMRDDLRTTDVEDLAFFNNILLEKYILSVKENKPNTFELSNNEILELMGVTKNSKPTLSGIMSFSKYPQATFPGFCITAVVVPGKEMGSLGSEGERFSSNKRIEGTIGEMLRDAVMFVTKNMNEKVIIDEEGKRIDKAEYPIKAVREIILNALIHRDYSIYTEGIPIQIVMYCDRIEFINPGGLYGNINIDSLGKIHSDTRNSTLTHMLEVLKVSENRYSGIPTIRMEMEKLGLQEPIFSNVRGTFKVVLKNQIAKDTINEELNQEEQIIDFCKEPRTRAELASYLGKTQYYVISTIINPLVESGKIKLTIPEKAKSKEQRYMSNMD